MLTNQPSCPTEYFNGQDHLSPNIQRLIYNEGLMQIPSSPSHHHHTHQTTTRQASSAAGIAGGEDGRREGGSCRRPIQGDDRGRPPRWEAVRAPLLGAVVRCLEADGPGLRPPSHRLPPRLIPTGPWSSIWPLVWRIICAFFFRFLVACIDIWESLFDYDD